MNKGDVIGIVTYLTVEDTDGNWIYGYTKNKQPLRAEKAAVADNPVLVAKATQKKKTSRSKLVELLTRAGNRPFRVTYRKKQNISDAVSILGGENLASIKTREDRRKLARKLLTGERRVLTGHLHSAAQPYGRSVVVDLEANPDDNIRLVDHRSIESLVIAGDDTEYTV